MADAHRSPGPEQFRSPGRRTPGRGHCVGSRRPGRHAQGRRTVHRLFAPTDDAFAALPAGTVEGLLEDIPALTDVLTYHVVSGKVLAADVVGLDSATTLQGTDVTVTVDGDTVLINDAQVIITDIETSNGVIHVIDAVLLPAS